jgi:hypothetical protein
LAYDDPEKKVFHLCIVNLVIGWEFYQNMNSYFAYLCTRDQLHRLNIIAHGEEFCFVSGRSQIWIWVMELTVQRIF